MAKKLKFKPTPAGILFLAAIGVLLIAIIILTVVGISRCKKDPSRTNDPTAETSLAPDESAEPGTSADPNASSEPATSADPGESPDPDPSADPNVSSDPNVTPGGLESLPPVVITTPGTSGSTSAAPGASATPAGTTVYTSPTSAMKNNAQKGYVNATDVNMRKGPGKSYDLVKSKIPKNTSVTLYVEQKVGSENWWFLKCGDKYGYIKSDYISKGSAPSTPAGSEATGKVVASKIALRKDASASSECIKEYENGEQLVVYSYKKDSNGKKWYYVKTSDGKKGYMYAEYVKVTGKVDEQ